MSDEVPVRQDAQCAEVADRAVTAWLQHSLADRYEPTLCEPLPPDLLALLDRFD